MWERFEKTKKIGVWSLELMVIKETKKAPAGAQPPAPAGAQCHSLG